jgi:hypothetical protein
MAPLVMRHGPEDGVRYILRGKELSARRKAEVESHTLSGPEEVVKVLGAIFGLQLPEGTRLRGAE